MKNVNLFRYTPILPMFDDGQVLRLPVDQFPCSNQSLLKDDGFPANEIDILDRFSRGASIDDDLIKIIAKRLEEVNSDEDNGLTIEQKIRVLKPSWVQTAAEYAEYSERVYQYLSETSSISQEQADKVVEQVSADTPSDDSKEIKAD